MSSTLVALSESLADAVKRAGDSVVGVLEGGRDGVSGTLWRGGFAVTAEHTIRDAAEVTVVLPSGGESKASVAGRDPGTDLALLKLSEKSSAPAIAAQPECRPGEIVLSVGRRKAEGLAASYGIISAVGGPWRTWQGAPVDRFFKLDLNPFPGFSGGPIVNARGEVLGIATSGPRRSVLTIPSSTVTRVVDQILERGRVVRGYLGVALQAVAVPESTRRSLAIETERGLLVLNVSPGSSAEKSGLMLGDIVVRVDDSPVRSVHSLQPALDMEKIGKTVSLALIRGGKLLNISAEVGERPQE